MAQRGRNLLNLVPIDDIIIILGEEDVSTRPAVHMILFVDNVDRLSVGEGARIQKVVTWQSRQIGVSKVTTADLRVTLRRFGRWCKHAQSHARRANERAMAWHVIVHRSNVGIWVLVDASIGIHIVDSVEVACIVESMGKCRLCYGQ